MDLHYKKMGAGSPLIILHGLYGMSDNWLSIAKALQDTFEIWLIDQRNHGQSPHSPEHDYPAMRDDLLLFMDRQQIERAIIMGHSMGGKTACFFAAAHPERVSKLIVVDISPRSYLDKDSLQQHENTHRPMIEAMQAIDFSVVESRTDIDRQLAKHITDKRIRQFLLKNIRRGKDNCLCWQFNLSAIANNLKAILDGLDPAYFDGKHLISNFPALFIRGELSNYITDKDENLIEQLFEFVEVATVFEAGHWLHAEQPDYFINTVKNWILSY